MYRSFAILLFLIVTLGAPAQEHAARASTFAEVLHKHYAKWVKGLPQGKLTAERIDKLVNDDRIRQDEAAAIAAIHVQFRAKNPPQSLDLQTLLSRHSMQPKDKRPDEQAAVVNFEAEFLKFRDHLRTVPRGLFEGELPHRTGIQQGHLGDCFVVSVLGEFATKHPTRLKQMVRQEGDGSYSVMFGDGDSIPVPKLTDSQIALCSSAGKQGLWLNVLEQAVALRLRKPGGSAVAIDTISNGGNTLGLIEMITNHRVDIMKLRQEKGKMSAVLGEMRQRLAEAQDHRRLVCVSSGKDGKSPQGIVSYHAFAVIGFDAAKDTVSLWNPWGNTFVPKGIAGLKNGYPTKNGKFTMPLAEFENVFSVMFVETASRLKVSGQTKSISAIN